MQTVSLTLQHKDDEIVVEIRDPHAQWRTRGYVASFVSDVLEGRGNTTVAFQRVKVGDLWFEVLLDASRRYINIVDPLRKCIYCGQERVRWGRDREWCLLCAETARKKRGLT
jgi:hypothetical protein